MLYSNKIVTINSKAVTVHTETGALLTSITSALNEGEPIGMDVTSHYLTIFTLEGYLKIFDLAELQPKLITPSKAVHDLINDFGEIIQAKTNATGSKVALTIAAANLVPDGKLYVYDIENNEMFIQNFRNKEKGQYEDASEVETTYNEEDIVEDIDIYKNRIPINFFWDRNDPRLLICDCRKLKSLESNGKRLIRSKSSTGEFYI